MNSENPPKVRCFFDIEIASKPVGRIVFDLFVNKCPKTVENFRSLCTGERGNGEVTGKPLHYQGVIFHRVIKTFMIQAGDFVNGNGTGGESIYGGTFADENLDVKHSKPYLLSMANRGVDTNGSQFFILTAPAPHLDGKHVVFGEVVKGFDVVDEIAEQEVDERHRPKCEVRIENCGELILQAKKKKRKKSSEVSEQNESDSSEDEKKKKRKHKKKKKKHKKEKRAHKASSDEEAKEEVFCTVRADEIPEEPTNAFLMRKSKEEKSKEEKEDQTADKKVQSEDGRSGERRDGKSGERGDGRPHESGDGDRRRQHQQEESRFGGRRYRRMRFDPKNRMIKGRGFVRYIDRESRSRSVTPPYWRTEQTKLLSINDTEAIAKAAEKWTRGDKLQELEEGGTVAHVRESQRRSRDYRNGREDEKGRTHYKVRDAVDPKEQERREKLRQSDKYKSANSLTDRFATEKGSKGQDRTGGSQSEDGKVKDMREKRSSRKDSSDPHKREVPSKADKKEYSPMKILFGTLKSKREVRRHSSSAGESEGEPSKNTNGTGEVQQRTSTSKQKEGAKDRSQSSSSDASLRSSSRKNKPVDAASRQERDSRVQARRRRASRSPRRSPRRRRAGNLNVRQSNRGHLGHSRSRSRRRHSRSRSRRRRSRSHSRDRPSTSRGRRSRSRGKRSRSRGRRSRSRGRRSRSRGRRSRSLGRGSRSRGRRSRSRGRRSRSLGRRSRSRGKRSRSRGRHSKSRSRSRQRQSRSGRLSSRTRGGRSQSKGKHDKSRRSRSRRSNSKRSISSRRSRSRSNNRRRRTRSKSGSSSSSDGRRSRCRSKEIARTSSQSAERKSQSSASLSPAKAEKAAEDINDPWRRVARKKAAGSRSSSSSSSSSAGRA